MKDKNSDREASVDRLLAGTLKARSEAVPDAACLDAETLAAWADGALDARERASAEAHAADCRRCQALLAAMVRTLPSPAPARSPWRLPALGWLVPLTVAATALVIWVAVPTRAPLQVSDGGSEVVQEEPPARKTAPAITPFADAKANVSTDVELRRRAANEREALAAPAVSVPSPADRLDRREPAPLEKQATAGAAPAAAANALADAASAAVPSAPRPAAEAGPLREAVAAPRMSNFAAAPEVVVVSSNPSTRFRLLRGGGVQRTADAGATWRTENTGATDTLTAGASPSPSVCWLIGPSGTVLLSTNDALWRRVAFPEAVSLRSVTATDGENATVTTADGRAFVTSDGGRTWSRTPDP